LPHDGEAVGLVDLKGLKGLDDVDVHGHGAGSVLTDFTSTHVPRTAELDGWRAGVVVPGERAVGGNGLKDARRGRGIRQCVDAVAIQGGEEPGRVVLAAVRAALAHPAP